MTPEEKIAQLSQFREKLTVWNESYDEKLREWLNQNVREVRRWVIEAGCFRTFTIAPPPAVGGLVMQDIDLFGMMFERIYTLNPTRHICDMIDMTIGVLRKPPAVETKNAEKVTAVRQGFAFVAMPMDKDDHQLVDVLEAIKAGAKECGLTAERIDEDESNERITDRMLDSIHSAEFVIADLTNGRPNVFYEAGYAHGIGKIPIYVAREGTQLHFDVKDYPVIMFRNMKELREGIARRLRAIAEKRVPERK
jgi:hypothetical protein